MNLLLEWLTHAMLGAIVAEWLLGKSLGNVGMQWGALLGIAPDLLEIPPTMFLDTAGSLLWRNGPLHSLPVAALAAWGLSSFFGKLWRKQRVTRISAFWWVFATWTSHALLDTLTIDGAAILWPLPIIPRTSFDLLHFQGPVPVLLIAVTLVRILRLTTRKQAAARRRALIQGSGLTAAWYLTCAGIKLVSSAGFHQDIDRRRIEAVRSVETPVGYNLLLRRAVVEGPEEFRVGYRSLFESFSAPVRWTIYPKDGQALAGPETMVTFATVSKRTGGWFIARKHSRGAWIADLRHPEQLVWGDKKGMVDSRFPKAWNVLHQARGDKLQALPVSRSNPAESTRRMIARTFGDKAAWEANPRLAGVTGSLPEFLRIDP